MYNILGTVWNEKMKTERQKCNWGQKHILKVYINNKAGGGDWVMVSKGTLLFKYVPKNKQNKLRKTKKNEIKEENY